MGVGSRWGSSVTDDDAPGLGGVEEEQLPFVEEDRHPSGVRCDDGDMGVGHEARLLPGAQRIGVTVWQPLDDSPCGDVESVKRTSCNVIAGSVGARNRIPVRVATRVAKHAIEAVEKAIGDCVFQEKPRASCR